MKKNIFIFICLSFPISNCRQKGSQKAEVSLATAKLSFETNDYNQSIADFSTLRAQNASDPTTVNYLSQSYLGRAGISLKDMANYALNFQKSGNNDEITLITDFLETLPDTSPLARTDISEAVHVMQSYNQSHPSPDSLANEVTYRFLYISYLIKTVKDTVVKTQDIKDLKDTKAFLVGLVKANYPEITEIIFQLQTIFTNLDRLTGALKNKLQSIFASKKFSFKYKGKSYNFDFSQGYENGVHNVLQNMLGNDYDYYNNLVTQLQSKVKQDTTNMSPDDLKKYKDDTLPILNELQNQFSGLADPNQVSELNSKLSQIQSQLGAP